MASDAPVWVRASAGCVGALMASVFGFILICALGALMEDGGPAWTGLVWQPDAGRFGILPMIWGTLLLSCSSLAMGWLLAVGTACFLNGLGPRWAAALLMGLIRFMTAIPTVVYGFASVFLLTPLIRNGLGGSGLCWLSASLVLSLQILPSMTLTMDGAMRLAAAETWLTAEALGLSQEQNLAWVALPACRKGLISAAMLGFGRAAGDTLIPTMLAGNAVQIAKSPLDALRTLTAHIGLVTSSDVSGQAYSSLFLAGGILLLVSASASLIVRGLSSRKGNLS